MAASFETITREVDDTATQLADSIETTTEVADAAETALEADESGEGFAVVADEVKSLAKETQEHTDEIAGRIEVIQSQTGETVTAAETETQQQVVGELSSRVDTLSGGEQ